MARRVFFSFYFKEDVWRVGQVRNSTIAAGEDTSKFVDGASWEAIKKQGDDAVQRWINSNMSNCSVVAVLIGKNTASRRWVKYEIKKAISDGRGLIGIHLTGMKNAAGTAEPLNGSNPLAGLTDANGNSFRTYSWLTDKGFDNIATWVERAAKAAGYT